MSGKKLKIADRKKLFIAIGAIVAIILILILLISSIKSARARKKAEEEANKPREITVQVTVNGTGISNDEADALIKEYFTRYYTYLGKLDSANIDMSDLFDQNSDEGLYAEHLEKAAMDYIITYRSNYPELSLGFGSANITINYEKLTTNSDGTLELELNINEAIKYDHTSPDTSYWAKQKHAFVLTSTSEGYRIVSHTADGPLDTLLSLMKASISSDSAYSLDALRDKVNENLNTWKESAKALTDKIYTDLANYNADSSKYRHYQAEISYNRDAAVTYADTWVSGDTIVRNRASWSVYDSTGNCVNYTSQCLYAGFARFDLKTPYVWKWYSEQSDNTSKEDGRSPSWTGINKFYEYVLNNEGSGMSASVGGNFYSGEPGDIIIAGTGDSFNMTMIIVEVVKDEDGNVIDYLVDSNTSDRKHYPISCWGYTTMELIHINGWNE